MESPRFGEGVRPRRGELPRERARAVRRGLGRRSSALGLRAAVRSLRTDAKLCRGAVVPWVLMEHPAAMELHGAAVMQPSDDTPRHKVRVAGEKPLDALIADLLRPKALLAADASDDDDDAPHATGARGSKQRAFWAETEQDGFVNAAPEVFADELARLEWSADKADGWRAR